MSFLIAKQGGVDKTIREWTKLLGVDKILVRGGHCIKMGH